MRLKDKVILVTGSTTGIGEAIARRVVAEGGRVMFHGRNAERGNALAAEVGERARFIEADLAEPDAPARVIEATVRAFGKLDGLVNNAAWVARNDLLHTDAAFFDKMMATNVRAPLLLIRAAYPQLKKTEGCVLNIGSVNAYSGESNLVAYSVSKGALMTLSRNTADSLCYDKIRVNHFNVGWVLTPNEYKQKIADGLGKNWPETLEPQYAPSGAIMPPEKIATAAVYWLSDESRPISGSVVELEQYPIIGRNPVKKGDEPS
jgi:NAD(P)-dependent dehydrogenase (short-subunit alcohol dehydrogenase family)